MQTIKWETVARYLFTYVISKNTHEMGEKIYPKYNIYLI